MVDNKTVIQQRRVFTKNFVYDSCQVSSIIKKHDAQHLCATILPLFSGVLASQHFEKVQCFALVKVSSIISPKVKM